MVAPSTDVVLTFLGCHLQFMVFESNVRLRQMKRHGKEEQFSSELGAFPSLCLRHVKLNPLSTWQGECLGVQVPRVTLLILLPEVLGSGT